jgi:hypothetical protein
MECSFANLLKCWKNMLTRIECADMLKKNADGNPICWFAEKICWQKYVLTKMCWRTKQKCWWLKTLPTRLAWPLGWIARSTCSSIMAGAHIQCGAELTAGTCLGRTFLWFYVLYSTVAGIVTAVIYPFSYDVKVRTKAGQVLRNAVELEKKSILYGHFPYR